MSRARARWRVVVTAGPTREHVDPVRFLSNESSGRMGFAIARAAAARGHHVTLIAGPVALRTPPGVERVDVVSALEMLAATRAAFAHADALYMAAAVADWRPARRLREKWRKEDVRGERALLELVKNPDLLGTLTRAKGRRLVVAFALETDQGEQRALEKLRRKRADWIVLNDPTALDATSARVILLGKDGSRRDLGHRPKAAIARSLLGLLEALPAQTRRSAWAPESHRKAP